MGYTRIIGPDRVQGASKVFIDGPSTTFGDLRVVTPVPQAQGDFVYNNINTQVFTTASFDGASVTVAGGLCSVNSGVEASGSATVRLRRGMKYRPGQGCGFRGTAVFDTPSAGSSQLIGAGGPECGYFIGYLGTSFGIVHAQTGQREIRALTVTTGAGTGDVTVTLNGNAFVIPVTGGADTSQTAYQLSLGDYSQSTDGGWTSDVIGSTVYFISARAASGLDGTYSVAGASIVGTFAQTKDGADLTTTFISSSQFNIDKLDGLGPSGMVIDPQKGNVFGIQFQYLGFGNCNFEIEDPISGKFTDFHTVLNANERTTPVLKNPNVAAMLTSANTGGTTSKTIKAGSISAFNEGPVIPLDPKYAKTFNIAQAATTGYKPRAILKTNAVFNGESCFGEFDIVQISAANISNNKYFTIGFFRDFEITGDVRFDHVDEGQSIVSYADLSLTANTITNLAEIEPFYEVTVGGDQAVTIDLTNLQFVSGVGTSRQGGGILFAIKGNIGANVGTFNISWFEQQ